MSIGYVPFPSHYCWFCCPAVGDMFFFFFFFFTTHNLNGVVDCLINTLFLGGVPLAVVEHHHTSQSYRFFRLAYKISLLFPYLSSLTGFDLGAVALLFKTTYFFLKRKYTLYVYSRSHRSSFSFFFFFFCVSGSFFLFFF